jgi:hypothetical protein
VKYLPLFHHFKAIYQFPKHIMFLVKIVANASLSNREWKLRWNDAPVQEDKKQLIASNKFVKHFHDGVLNVNIQNFYFFKF